jgi:hypothetical protein
MNSFLKANTLKNDHDYHKFISKYTCESSKIARTTIVQSHVQVVCVRIRPVVPTFAFVCPYTTIVDHLLYAARARYSHQLIVGLQSGISIFVLSYCQTYHKVESTYFQNPTACKFRP